MQKLLLFIDKVSTWVGHAFSWLIVVAHVLRSPGRCSRATRSTHPHAWAFDAMTMLYGTLFMMAGAYTLSKNGHVRGDVLYGFFRPRTAGDASTSSLYIVLLHPRRVRAHLRRLLLRRRVLGDQRALQRDRRRPADLSLQDHHPDRRARSCSRRGWWRSCAASICLKQGDVALARAGRRGSRRREAQGDGPREGRGHRQARRVMVGRGAPSEDAQGTLVRLHHHGPASSCPR